MTQEEVIKIVRENNPQEFKKFGKFRFRYAEAEERVATIIDGVLETEKTAKPGDIILVGSKGENYTIPPETFKKRYEVAVDGWAYPTGMCYGNIYHGPDIIFTASWGEEMICKEGDYLVSPDKEFSEAYRIEKEAFEKTYKPTGNEL